jgi:hypothetical protein
VKPVKLEIDPEDSEMSSWFQVYFPTTEEDIYKLTLRGDGYTPGMALNLAKAKRDAYMLSWRLNELKRNNHWIGEMGYHGNGADSWTSRFNFRVIAGCCLAVSEGQTIIRDILKYCYRCEVLEPCDLGSKKLNEQISAVFECLLTLNFSKPLGSRETPFMLHFARGGIIEDRPRSSLAGSGFILQDISPLKAPGLDLNSFFNIVGLRSEELQSDDNGMSPGRDICHAGEGTLEANTRCHGVTAQYYKQCSCINTKIKD